MIKWFENFETRDIIALIVVIGFLVAQFTNYDTNNIYELALLVVGFYFGNKATKDKM